MTFYQKLSAIATKNSSLVCVGLDSELSKIPAHIQKLEHPQFEFNKAIIDATHDLVCAYKPNSSFYESQGPKGMEELKMTVDYLKEKYPEVITIDDAKRGDNDVSNGGYVKAIFDYYGFDSVTLHPYLGKQALQPFLDRADKGCIILCRTSNPGAGEIQDSKFKVQSSKLNAQEEDSMVTLYQYIALQVRDHWNTNGNCLLVVGATYPEELAEIRALCPDMSFLVPGLGAQGGDVEKTVKAGLDKNKAGMIINSSRGIIFAGNGKDFAEKAREETMKLINEINKYR